MIGIKTEVMPFVRFYTKDYGRNEAASVESGVHVPLRATFIEITGHGSKDCSEFIADEWLPRKRADASRGSYNLKWVEHFEEQYAQWKKGHELPRQGTPILTWATISPEQNARVRALGYQVIEDLAALPDNALGQLGLDGRVLRDQARAWLAEGKDKGINVRLIGEQTAKIDAQQAQIDQLLVLVAELKAQLPEKRGPGRPRREDSEAA
jgi:hypothetical protein